MSSVRPGEMGGGWRIGRTCGRVGGLAIRWFSGGRVYRWAAADELAHLECQAGGHLLAPGWGHHQKEANQKDEQEPTWTIHLFSKHNGKEKQTELTAQGNNAASQEIEGGTLEVTLEGLRV